MNVVIKSSAWLPSDLTTLFGDEEVIFASSVELSALMRELKIYPSASQARQAGRKGHVPLGYTEYKASKKHSLYIWNPV